MKRIMIVDDDKGALTLIGIMLDRGGFQVVSAQNGYQALDKLDQETPDLIILDLMMPGMDGIELCKVIRERTETARTPILILSTKSDAQSVIQSMEAGATDYLPKPIFHNDLVSKVRDMLEAAATV